MSRSRVAALSMSCLLASSPGCAARPFRVEAPAGSPCVVAPTASGRLAGREVTFSSADGALVTTVGLSSGEAPPFEALVATSILGWRCGVEEAFRSWERLVIPPTVWARAPGDTGASRQSVPLDELVPSWVEPGTYVLGLTVDAVGQWGVSDARPSASWRPAPGRALVRIAIEVPGEGATR